MISDFSSKIRFLFNFSSQFVQNVWLTLIVSINYDREKWLSAINNKSKLSWQLAQESYVLINVAQLLRQLAQMFVLHLTCLFEQ